MNRQRCDVCYYCGKEYHPMDVYTNAGSKIWVCSLEFVYDGDGHFVDIKPVDACTKKAVEAGYVFRRDLTPRR